jgi:hypothetical protein
MADIYPVIILDKDSKVGDFETMTISTVSKGFTTTKLLPTSGTFEGKRCQEAILQVISNPVNIRLDGTDPTGSVGFTLNPTQVLILKRPFDISNFRAIRTGSDATLNIIYRY